VGILYALIASAILWLAIAYPVIQFLGYGIKPYQVGIGFAIWYTWQSILVVKEDMIATKILLGYKVCDISGRPTFAPWPRSLCYLREQPTLAEQREIPAEPHDLHHGEDAPPPGKRIPLRIISGGSTDPHVVDYLDRRLTIEVAFRVRLAVSSMMQFVSVIGSFDQAFKQIEDEVKEMLNTEFALHTPKEIIADQNRINNLLRTLADDLVSGRRRGATSSARPWGMTVEDIGLTYLDITKTINQAMRDVAVEGLRAQAAIEKARGEAESYTITQTQVAAMRELFLQRQATGFADLMAALDITDPALAVAVLQTEQARELLQNAGNVTVFAGGSGGGVANMYGLVQSLVQGATAPSGATAPPTGSPPASTTPPPTP
jgi:regulator of protease activity HflC (stomatin/prohibitin superfamily)